MNKLHEFITTEYAIYPNFGVVEFFEYVICQQKLKIGEFRTPTNLYFSKVFRSLTQLILKKYFCYLSLMTSGFLK